MTTPRDLSADDTPWRRPDGPDDAGPGSGIGGGGGGGGIGGGEGSGFGGGEGSGSGGRSDAGAEHGGPAGASQPSALRDGSRVHARHEEAFWARPPAAPGPGTNGRGGTAVSSHGGTGFGSRGLGDPPATPPAAGYAGPPRNLRPPPGWRPPLHLRAQPPRPLPPQDAAALDEAEQDARTVTYGVGMLAGAICMVLMFLLCARIIF